MNWCWLNDHGCEGHHDAIEVRTEMPSKIPIRMKKYQSCQ